jgi:homoserine kinase
LNNKVVVAAPASCANLGPGFDVFGLALDEPKDLLELELEESGKFSLNFNVLGNVSIEHERNAASYVILRIAEVYQIKGKITARLRKNVPIGIGLGSSAASSVASSFAMNHVFKLNMSVREILSFASEGEKLCSGAAHLDNVTASLLGGFTISTSNQTNPISLKLPENMSICIVTPSLELPERKTEYARSLLPESVKLSDVVSNIRNASLIVAGVATSNIDMIGAGMEDNIVEKARMKMNPHYTYVKEEAKREGASGVCISGSGPSILAIVDSSKANPRKVLGSMVECYREASIKASGFITKPGRGAHVVR